MRTRAGVDAQLKTVFGEVLTEKQLDMLGLYVIEVAEEWFDEGRQVGRTEEWVKLN